MPGENTPIPQYLCADYPPRKDDDYDDDRNCSASARLLQIPDSNPSENGKLLISVARFRAIYFSHFKINCLAIQLPCSGRGVIPSV